MKARSNLKIDLGTLHTHPGLNYAFTKPFFECKARLFIASSSPLHLGMIGLDPARGQSPIPNFGLGLEPHSTSELNYTQVKLCNQHFQTLHISIRFKDDRRSLFINPIHVQYIDIMTEMSLLEDYCPKSDYSRIRYKTIVKYGTKINSNGMATFKK